VLAGQVAALFDRATAPAVSYRVTLASRAELAGVSYIGSPQSQLEWTDEENGQRHTYTSDPQAGLYRNVMTGLFLLLPVQGQL
jgi:putative cardiolipin synthase